MPEPPAASGVLADPPLNEPRIESWGEIANYLKRDIRTVQRWEKDYALPIRRLMIGKQGQVYAYRTELDRWVRERQPKTEIVEPSPDPSRENGNASNPNQAVDSGRQTKFIDKDEQHPPKSTKLWKILLAIFVLAVALGLVPSMKQIYNRFSVQPAGKILLFVRPFTNLTGEPNQQIFVRGLKDEMIIQLGKLDPAYLGVFAPTTSDEASTWTIADLHQKLNADFVLEGSVRRENEKLRIDVALISTKDQSQIWTKSYTEEALGILQLQDKLTADVATEISSKLPAFTGRAGASGRPVNPEAYRNYLEGRVYWLDRNILRSMDSYKRALAIDPDYAPALAGLATSYLLFGETPNDILPPSESMPKARQAAERALTIDPNLADAHCVLANIAMSYDHDLLKAERLFKQAIQEDPSNVTAHEWYADYLTVTNQISAADTQINAALQIDPASPLLNAAYSGIKYLGRDFDGSIQQAEKTLKQSPGYPYAELWLGASYREKKMLPQALAIFDRACQQSNNNPAMVAMYGHALGLSGETAKAKAQLALLQSLAPTRYVPALYFAAIHLGLGDKEAAIQSLEQAYKEGNDRLVYLGMDPIADPLRGDPRFVDLMKRVGLH
jgi:TolB-like protein/Tfp pilus assembly protein PilF